MHSVRWLSPLLILLVAAGCGPQLEAAAAESEASSTETAGVQESSLSRPIIKNTCGNAGVAPQIFSNAIMSPTALPADGLAPANWNPGNARLSRGGYDYVSGNGLRFELVSDGCTYIKEVKLGARLITPTYTEGYWYSAQASTTPPQPGRYNYNLWVFYPPQPDGGSQTLTLTLGRTGGSGTVTYTLPIVFVESVEAKNVDAPIGFSRAELINMFGKSLYTLFNGATNSVVLTSTDGSTRRIYGYDPNSLQVSVDGPSGVSFSFKFKVDLNNWCDPTARAHGNFRLKADSAGIRIDWINAATASLDWPTGCAAVQLVPILGLIPNLAYKIIEDTASSSIRGEVEKAVTTALPSVGNAQAFLNGSSTGTNELRVHLKLPVPSIKLRVPYDAFDLPNGATPFAGGEVLTLIASGLGVNDYVANVSPQTTLWSGPNGVPRAGSTNWPAAQTLSRAAPLVWNDVPVARLLARSTTGGIALPTTTTSKYEPGCSIKVPSDRFSSNGWVRFGVNDSAADAQRLRAIFGAAPGYMLRVLFLNDLDPGIANAAPRCKSFSTGPVVSPIIGG
ncbi:MAG: hypothetical protein ACT4TC_10610 [Myxococcaceae bacterium]